MRYLFFTVLLLYTTVKCFGGVISGKVVDTSGKPVGFANVISINCEWTIHDQFRAKNADVKDIVCWL